MQNASKFKDIEELMMSIAVGEIYILSRSQFLILGCVRVPYGRPVVLKRSGELPQGGVNNFPGGREPLRALQHEKFDHEIYQ